MRVLFVLGLMLTLLLPGCGGESYSSGASHPELLGYRSFTVDKWAAAGQVERGEMVASYLALYPPAGMTRGQVTALLGKPTGYYDHDENFAYVVGPTAVKSPYAAGYLLVFLTDKTTEIVSRTIFVPDLF